MTHFEIILSALALAFTWVHALGIPVKIQELNIKPLNCMMCLTGWFSFAFSLSRDVSPIGIFTALLFAAVGVFIGAMFEAIMMRYL